MKRIAQSLFVGATAMLFPAVVFAQGPIATDTILKERSQPKLLAAQLFAIDQIPHRRRVPGAAPRRGHATGVESVGDRLQRGRAGSLDGGDNRQHVGGVAVGRRAPCGRSRAACGLVEPGVAQPNAAGPRGGQGVLRPARDHRAFFFRDRRVDVEHERIHVGTKLSYPVRHQAGDEVRVAAQAIELCHGHRAFLAARRGRCRRELRAAL
jgi:hypothetical protein